jgi:hypothetical protein
MIVNDSGAVMCPFRIAHVTSEAVALESLPPL